MNANLTAFLRVIRAGESSQDDSAYTVMFGGTHFTDFSDHPRQAIQSPWGWTSAAGAYQAMCAVPGKVKTDTWGDFIRSQGPHDFSPESQDKFAVWCIKRRKALEDVEAGRFREAIAKCGKEWASLPGSPYGQPTKTYDQALAIYRKYGGTLEGEDSGDSLTQEALPPEPITYTPAGEAGPQEATPMAPLLLALGSSLIDIFTPLAKEKITKEVSRHTNNPAVAEQIANAAIDTAKAATGLSDPIEAVAAAKKDPAVMAKVEASALDQLAKLAPLLDKMHAHEKEAWAAEESSRDEAAKRAAGDQWDMSRTLVVGAFGIIGSLILFVCVVAGFQAFRGDIKPEVWAQIAGLIGFATGVGTTIYAYRFGTSRSSATKDIVIGELSKRK